MGGILSSQLHQREDQELRERLGMGRKEVQIVVDSWAEVKKFGAEKAGIILFKRFFIAAPDTFHMFDEFRDLPDWEESREFKHHCKIVMNIVGSAVNLLREPESLDSTLEYLGLKHEGFAITQAHFDLMGVEFLETLKEALGVKYTKEVEVAWLALYTYITKIIMMGMYRMEVGVKKMDDST
jgi:hemoglobin-like flavoprotein